MEIKSREYYLQILDEFYDSYYLKFSGVDRFWPIIRIQSGYFFFLYADNRIDVDKVDNYLKSVNEEFRFSDIKCFFKHFFKLLIYRYKLWNKLKGKVLLFGYREHYYTHNNVLSNLYLSPIYTELKNMNIQSVELLFSKKSTVRITSDLDIFYSTIYDYQKMVYKFKSTFFTPKVRIFNSAVFFKEFLDKKGIQNSGHIFNIITSCLVEQEVKYNTFKQLLKTTNPKLIWSYCYYDNNMMALNRAANHLKIKNIEYQHSTQSDQHFAYAPWKNSEMYREFFPNTFWVWKQSDADRVLNNFSGKNYIPNVIVGGNLSVIQQKEQFNYKTPEATKGILVSLQGIWIPGFVEEFIENDTGHIWYFRLHPRYPEDKQKLTEFKNKFHGKVEMHEANSLSLYELFTKVKINITDFSGVAFEAEEFGIKNIIVGEKGLKVYNEKIMDGKYFYADSNIKLMNEINSFINIEVHPNQITLKERENIDNIISNTFI